MKWLILLVLLLGAPGPAAAQAARVIDGDTVRIGTITYRLHGVDAPEKAQICRKNGIDWLCGQEAGAYLRRLVGNHSLACRERDRDRYGRVVAVCWAGATELNREIVRAGLAWAYSAYSGDYEDAELEARIGGRGIWASDALPPWEWRRQRRRGTARNPG